MLLYSAASRWDNGSAPSYPLQRILLAAIAMVPFAARGASPSGDATRGKVAYESKCGGCHSVETNRIGPLHRGVVGRVPGSVPGFDYSPAVKKLGGTWSPSRLDRWLQDPQKLAPGSRMYFSVTDSVERRDIIAYLQSISPLTRAMTEPRF